MSIARFMYSGQYSQTVSSVRRRNFLSDAATLTPSSEAAGGDNAVENVQDDDVNKVWETTGKAAEYANWDLGVAMQMTMLYIANHNLSPAATLKLSLHTSDLGAIDWSATAAFTVTFGFVDVTALNDAGSDGTRNVSANPIFIVSKHRREAGLWDADEEIKVEYGKAIWLGNRTYRYGQLYIADSGSDQSVIRIGRLCFGTYDALDNNYTILPEGAFSIEPVDTSEEGERWRVTQTAMTLRAKYKRYNQLFGAMGNRDKGKMTTMFNVVGKAKPIVWMPFPTETAETNYNNAEIIVAQLVEGLSFVPLDPGLTTWKGLLQLKEMV